MASIPSELAASSVASLSGKFLVMLTPAAPDQIEATLDCLGRAFVGQHIAVSISDLSHEGLESLQHRFPEMHPVSTAPEVASGSGWVLTAADFFNLYKSAKEQDASGCLLLGPDSHTLTAEALKGLEAAVAAGADLVVPRYDAGPREGLVNSALLYPVTRAIFGGTPRFPLAVDLGMSIRMAARLATIAQKFTAAKQNDALLWPVAEAAAANFNVVEVEVGKRTFPQPENFDLNTLLAHIASSLFTEVETYAAFWQRARTAPHAVAVTSPVALSADSFPDVQPMLQSFQLAYKDLHEIWSLVLPPASLLALKRLSQMPPESFRMSDSLWARTVFDFILAYRLRTINRGHLLGALTPLYLAWVASHILLARSGVDPEKHIDEVVTAFETDKAYLVSRWRWPDRFNP